MDGRKDREAKTHNSNKGQNSGNIISGVINSSDLNILSVKVAALKFMRCPANKVCKTYECLLLFFVLMLYISANKFSVMSG